jgi:hypothetical protein
MKKHSILSLSEFVCFNPSLKQNVVINKVIKVKFTEIQMESYRLKD